MNKKKLTANSCMKIMKDNFDNVALIEWHGAAVSVKRVISFDEMVEFSNSVVDDCYTKDSATYRPEIRDFSIRANTVKLYTDIELPNDISSLYEFLYRTDIIDQIHTVICRDQYFNIVEAIKNHIDALVRESVSVAAGKMIELTNSIELMSNGIKDVVGDISAEDIASIKQALMRSDFEEKLIAAYQKTKEPSDDGKK